MKIKFKHWNCNIVFREYKNGRLSMQLLEDKVPCSPVATASVNIPNEPLEKDEIAIKDYSENEGILDCLVQNKVVSAPVRYVNSGFVKIPICKLLIK